VVDPARHLIVLPELEDVEMFTAGVEPDNVASVRDTLESRFHVLRAELDPEGIMYFVWRPDAESVCYLRTFVSRARTHYLPNAAGFVARGRRGSETRPHSGSPMTVTETTVCL
jgi:hypothetical protein